MPYSFFGSDVGSAVFVNFLWLLGCYVIPNRVC